MRSDAALTSPVGHPLSSRGASQVCPYTNVMLPLEDAAPSLLDAQAQNVVQCNVADMCILAMQCRAIMPCVSVVLQNGIVCI